MGFKIGKIVKAAVGIASKVAGAGVLGGMGGPLAGLAVQALGKSPLGIVAKAGDVVGQISRLGKLGKFGKVFKLGLGEKGFVRGFEALGRAAKLLARKRPKPVASPRESGAPDLGRLGLEVASAVARQLGIGLPGGPGGIRSPARSVRDLARSLEELDRALDDLVRRLPPIACAPESPLTEIVALARAAVGIGRGR